MQARVVVQHHLRLVMQAQLAAAHGLAQRVLQGQAFLHGLVHLQAVEHDARAALGLGAVHRDVGVAYQRVDVPAIGGKHGHADAGLRRQHHPAGDDRFGKPRHQAVGEVGGFLRAAVRHGQHEFVAGQARHHVAFAQFAAEPLGEFAQQGVACGMALGVVDDLEAVDVDEQQGHRAVAARGAQQHLFHLAVEQRPVGQPGQGVEERQLVHARSRAIALDGQGAQVQADIDHALVELVRRAVLPVVQGERAQHAPVVALHRIRPAGADPQRQEGGVVGLPARVAFDVAAFDRLPAPGRRPAGADHGAGQFAVDDGGDLLGQAGGRQGAQAAVVVQPDHRGDGLGHHLFHFAADQGQHLLQRLFADDRAQHLAVQLFVQLAVGDVGVDAQQVADVAVGVVHRVDHRRDPQRHPVLGIDQQLGPVALLRVQLPAHPFDRFRVGMRARQEIAGPAAGGLLQRIAQHAREPLVDPGDAGRLVADDDRVVAVVDDPRYVGSVIGEVRRHGDGSGPHGRSFPKNGFCLMVRVRHGVLC